MNTIDDVASELRTGIRGGFAAALGELYGVADRSNRQRLEEAFPELLSLPPIPEDVRQLIRWMDDRARLHDEVSFGLPIGTDDVVREYAHRIESLIKNRVDFAINKMTASGTQGKYAKNWETLLDLVGTYQDGSDQPVTLAWDDATRTAFITVEHMGKRKTRYYVEGSGFEAAINKVIEALEKAAKETTT